MSLALSPFYEELRPFAPLWRVDGWEIVRCVDSGLVYLKDPPSDAELERFYSRGYFEGEASRKGYASYEADEGVLRANFRDLLGRVRWSLPRPSEGLELLDVGCAYGYFLDEARRYFKTVRGLEMHPEVAAVGRDRFGLDVVSEPSRAYAPASLDVITLWDVIEHLRRPRATLLDCARALRPGGRIHLTTGDLSSPLARALGRRWRLVNPPQHLTYFSAATLRALLEGCGFRVRDVHHPGKRVSLDFALFILGYLSGGRVRPPEALRALLDGRRTVPGLSALLGSPPRAYVNLFDVVHVEAEKI